MSQESMRIKSEDKKAFGKFAAYMAAALIIGVLLGVGMGFAKLNGMDMTGHTVLNAIFFALPYLYVLYNNYIYNVYKDGKYRLEGET